MLAAGAGTLHTAAPAGGDTGAERQAAAETAEDSATLPPGFALVDTPTGQPAYNLTDFGFLPDGSAISTGKDGGVTWVSATGDRTRELAVLPTRSNGDLGLVGMAVAPDFARTRHVYLARALPDEPPGFRVRLSRWTVTGSPDPTGLSEERRILQLTGSAQVHAMTGVVADPDGSLWVSVGDMAKFCCVDPEALNALDPNSGLGKLLHVLPDGRGHPSNPFYSEAQPASWRSRFYAGGFRSPFRFSLDPETGAPLLGDVGWLTWEEVDVVRPGRFYGWPCWEGLHRTPGYRDLAACASVANTAPVWDYRHGDGADLLPDQGNSVTGGRVYTGSSYPAEYQGSYFFGDYVGEKIWSMRLGADGQLSRPPDDPPFGTHVGAPVEFDEAENGDLVYADIATGNLRRLTYSAAGNTAPVARIVAVTDPDTRTVSFDASGSRDHEGDALSYRWDFGDGSTGSGPNPTHGYPSGPDTYEVALTVSDPSGATGTTTLTVAPSNRQPELTLTTPGGNRFAVGEPITLTGTATDAEDGELRIVWTSATVHCQVETSCHRHPGEGATGPGWSGQLTDHPNSRTEVTATATDSRGAAASVTYVALPREHRLTLLSNLPARLEIPGESTGPSAMVAEGAVVDVLAAAVAEDQVATFEQWSDGSRLATHAVTIGSADLTLTATYLTPIDRKYARDTRIRDLLGAPTGPETGGTALRSRQFANGRLYWSPSTGAHEVHGEILEKYLERGGPEAVGPPASDQQRTQDGTGRFNEFAESASIYWTRPDGAHLVDGPILARWTALGREASFLSYPTSDVFEVRRGLRGEFRGGHITWVRDSGQTLVRRW